MSNLLVYIESSNSIISKANLPIFTAAQKLKEQGWVSKITGLLIGGPGTEAAATLASGYGFEEIVYVENQFLDKYNAIDYSLVLNESIADLSPAFVMCLSSARGKDFFPRCAAILDSPQVSEVVEFLNLGEYRRPTFAGNIIADVSVESPLQFITVRASAFDQPNVASSRSSVRKIDSAVLPSELVEVISFDTVKSERPELGEASVVVSGGRALKSKENFESVLFPLADALGAAIGASRAAVDSGYAPNDWQVGQTGKIVAPKLYIAIGISGAVQHLAGMKDSKVIVAINKDSDAPIFEIADYALVGDLFEIIPQFINEIKA